MIKTCCFTGHRPQSLPWRFNESDPRCLDLKERLYDQIHSAIERENVRHFISGVALGVDIWAAELVLQLRDQFAITLECAIPCLSQDARWNARDRERYRTVLARANTQTVLQPAYSPDCFDRRNRYMVDHSQLVIAIWSGAAGGTANTVAYARSLGRQLVVIDPLNPIDE